MKDPFFGEVGSQNLPRFLHEQKLDLKKIDRISSASVEFFMRLWDFLLRSCNKKEV